MNNIHIDPRWRWRQCIKLLIDLCGDRIPQSCCEHRNDRNFIKPKTKRLLKTNKKHKTKLKRKPKSKPKNQNRKWKTFCRERREKSFQTQDLFDFDKLSEMSAPSPTTTTTATIIFRKRIKLFVFFVQFLDIFVFFCFVYVPHSSWRHNFSKNVFKLFRKRESGKLEWKFAQQRFKNTL